MNTYKEATYFLKYFQFVLTAETEETGTERKRSSLS